MAYESVSLIFTLLILANPPIIGTSDVIEVSPQNSFTSSSQISANQLQPPTPVLSRANLPTSPLPFSDSESTKEIIKEATEGDEESSLLSDEELYELSMPETTPISIVTTTEEVGEVMTTLSTVETTLEVDLDESEPYFQRYVRTGNRIASGIATIFLLTMILFAVASKLKKIFSCVKLIL